MALELETPQKHAKSNYAPNNDVVLYRGPKSQDVDDLELVAKVVR